MLKNIISKIKPATPDGLSPEESAAADSISTLEKADARLSKIDTALSDPLFTPERRSLLRSQRMNVSAALVRHRLNVERARVADLVQTDQANAENALIAAKADLPVAVANLKAETEKHAAIAARLIPLHDAIKKSNAAREQGLADAQRNFDAAIASGDEAAESLAAEQLSNAKFACAQSAIPSSANELRIEAIGRELVASQVKVDEARAALDDAEKAQRKAVAELALLEYDKQAQALFEAFLTQLQAVAQCNGDRRLRRVDEFTVNVSSPARLVFIGREAEQLLSHTPDLKILALNVDDLPAPEKPKLLFNYYNEPIPPSSSVD